MTRLPAVFFTLLYRKSGDDLPAAVGLLTGSAIGFLDIAAHIHSRTILAAVLAALVRPVASRHHGAVVAAVRIVPGDLFTKRRGVRPRHGLVGAVPVGLIHVLADLAAKQQSSDCTNAGGGGASRGEAAFANGGTGQAAKH